MKRRKKPIHIIFDTGNYIFLIILTVSCLYPLLYVLFGSLSDPYELAKKGSQLLLSPAGFSTGGYRAAIAVNYLKSGILNSIYYVFVGTVMNIFFTGLMAYVLSTKAFFKKYIMIMVVITMFFGGGLIPSYLVIKDLGLIGSRMVLILPGLIGPMNLILMRTFFQGIPDSLTESAIIDGAGYFKIFTKIIIPLSMPIFAVIALYCGVGHWNSWFPAQIYLPL